MNGKLFASLMWVCCMTLNTLLSTASAQIAPAITTQPTNQTVCSGSTATFSVTASGSGLNYSWARHNNGGWGSAWSASGSGGTFRASSTDNEFGEAACTSLSSADDINSPSGNALGMWGGFSGDEVATRNFAALAVGQVVSIDFDNGNVDTGSKVGFSLQTSGGTDVLQFYFIGGDLNYNFNDGVEQDTGIFFQRTGLRVQFVLTSASAYTLIVTPCGGTATTFTGSYSGNIAKLKLFNQNTSGGDAYNVYFNNFLIGGYTDNADNYSGDFGGQDKGDQPVASGNGGSTYTTPVLRVGDNGAQYDVVVDGSGGAVLSSAATVTVNPLPAVLTGTRPYDGTATAAFGILSVSNKVGGDDVFVASGSASLASSWVGTNAIISVAGMALGGTTAPNYTLAGASGTVRITNPNLPFSITSECFDNTGTNFVMVWDSIPGVVYQVRTSTNLNTWSNVGTPIEAVWTTTTGSIPKHDFPAGSFFDVFGK
jgi:hypothetical protein